MTGGPRKKTPLWQAIAAALRRDIGDGIYSAGAKLPTEAALADRFGVNRHTVRHAISSLVDAGLVRTRRGAGAFVTMRPTEYPIGRRVRFHQNLLAAGRMPQKRVLRVEECPASQRVSDRLQLNPGEPVCIYHGLSLSDNQPIALFQSHFPALRFVGIAKRLTHDSSVTNVLRQFGVSDYTRTATRISARAADATQALHLNLSEGAPLLLSEGVNVDPQGIPVEFGVTWFAGDRITLTLGDMTD